MVLTACTLLNLAASSYIFSFLGHHSRFSTYLYNPNCRFTCHFTCGNGYRSKFSETFGPGDGLRFATECRSGESIRSRSCSCRKRGISSWTLTSVGGGCDSALAGSGISPPPSPLPLPPSASPPPMAPLPSAPPSPVDGTTYRVVAVRDAARNAHQRGTWSVTDVWFSTDESCDGGWIRNKKVFDERVTTSTAQGPLASQLSIVKSYGNMECTTPSGGPNGGGVKNFGNIDAPTCAKRAQSEPRCGDRIMHSSAYPSWGCRCCRPGDVGTSVQARYWTIHKLGEGDDDSLDQIAKSAFDGRTSTVADVKADDDGMFWVRGTSKSSISLKCAKVVSALGSQRYLNSGERFCLDKLDVNELDPSTGTWVEIGCGTWTRSLSSLPRYRQPYYRRVAYLFASPPPPPPGYCTDTCKWSSDGLCDDGGPGSQYPWCAYGTDCTDCGVRFAAPSSPPRAPDPLPPPPPLPSPPPSPPSPPPPSPSPPPPSPSPPPPSPSPPPPCPSPPPPIQSPATPPPPLDPPRPPLAPTDGCASAIDVVLVLDGSGSICSSVKQIRRFVRDLTTAFVLGPAATQFAIVEFDRDAKFLTHLTTDATELETAMANYRCGGLTSISAGLYAALKELKPHLQGPNYLDNNPSSNWGRFARPEAIPVVFLLTDGKQNVDGGQAAAQLAAEALHSESVTVFSWGFGGSPLQQAIEDMATRPASTHANFQPSFTDVADKVLELAASVCTEVSSVSVATGCDASREVIVQGRGFTEQSAANTTVRFTVLSEHPQVSNATVDQGLVTLLESTKLQTTLPDVDIWYWDAQLDRAVTSKLHSFSGKLELAVSLDGGKHFTAHGVFFNVDCASPPPPARPPPPPLTPQAPLARRRRRHPPHPAHRRPRRHPRPIHLLPCPRRHRPSHRRCRRAAPQCRPRRHCRHRRPLTPRPHPPSARRARSLGRSASDALAQVSAPTFSTRTTRFLLNSPPRATRRAARLSPHTRVPPTRSSSSDWSTQAAA